MEERKVIEIYGRKIMVSNLGNIKRLNEKSKQFGNIGEWYNVPIRESRGGYLRVVLSIPNTNKVKSILVHRIVGYAFLGLDIYNKKQCICHKDDNRKNNRLDNLFVGTYKDNVIDAITKGRHFIAKGESNGNSKYDESFIIYIKQRLKNGEKPGRLYKELSIPKSTMYDISRGSIWGWI